MSSEDESRDESESEEEVEEETASEEEEEIVVVKKVKRVTKKRKGKDKDPNKPKRNLTSYFLYSNANRARIKKENPELGFGELAKAISVEYKALDPKEKKIWENKSATDKIRYLNEMKSYVPPSDDSDSGDGKTKKKKKKKDPNRPKKNLTSYLLFSNAVRNDVKQKNPDATFGDLSKLISKRFKVITVEERAKFDKLAAKDKIRYQKEMKSYSC